MKITGVAFIFLLISTISSGQSHYKTIRDDKTDLKSEFILNPDSTCYLKTTYSGNSFYKIYKGRINKIQDTLYEFHYQPIVQFTAMKRIAKGDTITTFLSAIDTSLSNISYFEVKAPIIEERHFRMSVGWNRTYWKGISKNDISINTNFIDPITYDSVYISIHTDSSPVLYYYGSKTTLYKTQISIVKNNLTIYADNKFIEYNESYLLSP